MANSTSLTPMMQQYMNIKEQHKDCLLLFRMGDFYELFFDDATIAANILGIALTKRGNINGSEIPMCGIPHHALNNYLSKLTDADLKIAICEQLESPEEAKKREGAKAVVKREVVRIITPGTIIEDGLIDDNRHNYLLSITKNKSNCAICYIDLATCSISITEIDIKHVSSELAKLNPKEILLSDNFQLDQNMLHILAAYKGKLVYQVDSNFDYIKCAARIKDIYQIHSLDALGNLSKLQISAIGAILEYLSITQKANIPELTFPKIINISDHMQIDAGTRRNLEITKTLTSGYKGSLLDILDICITKSGKRLLLDWVSNPLANINIIQDRLNITEFFYKNQNLISKIRLILKQISDIERALSRIAMKRAFPRDLTAIKFALTHSLELKELLFNAKADNLIYENLIYESEIFDLIDSSINENAPINPSDVGIIKPSYHPRISELSKIIYDSSSVIQELQIKYRAETGIDNLKISHNNIFGFFVDVTAKASSKIQNDKFIHKQTLASSVRYITTELKELESKIINAKALMLGLERELFADICRRILIYKEQLLSMSRNISEIDVFCSFARLAKERSYVRPEITNDTSFDIKDGKHPIVEVNLKSSAGNFVPNSCNLSDHEKLWLITGPNMAGKSTFLRQNALISIMAHIGSFVPASFAKIGLIDKLFSRIGAADDLSNGNSTFMVEMIETSAILNQSTDRSLIILDEVGRGTSTYDGVSIAWSSLEYIHNNIGARALFATHYHELTELEKLLPNLKNYTIKISENDGKIMFLHNIIPGAADKSYGIHVAELAGIPKQVTRRAKQILQKLERDSVDFKISDHNMSLFDYAQNQIDDNEDLVELKNKLDEINPDSLSPKEALDAIYKLKEKVNA